MRADGGSFDALLRPLPCWVEIDLDRVARNVRALAHWLGPSTAIAAVVKAEAYGLGARQIARTVLNEGAERLAVARVHEGVELRRSGIAAPILVLSRTDPLQAAEAVRHDLTVTVDTLELAAALGTAAVRARRQVAVHLKVDTGMHRFGVEPDRALPLARALSETDALRVEGLWTHFASADEVDLSYTREQMRCFEYVAGTLARAGYRFPVRHAANSAATLAFPPSHLDFVRVGLTLHGVSPLRRQVQALDLEPAVALRARIGRVLTIARGETVGYGETWQAERPTRVGLLLAGYADGVPRELSNRGKALVSGREAPVIGRVSMDHVTIDITDIPGVEAGSVATLFGEDGEGRLDLWQVADAAGTLPHDILSGIGGRVARAYRQRGELVSVARLNGTMEVAPEA